MAEKLYDIVSEFHRLDRNVPLALYKPAEKTERSQIAILAMHGADYLSWRPLIEIAKRGYITAGANPNRNLTREVMLYDMRAAVEFLKNYPGVKKVILVGHSNGGCICSGYQFIAENGIDRFRNTKRIVPFTELEPLTPADGLMLVDANYGIMDLLQLDPAVKSLKNGFERIPELDIYNPENGYNPKGSHYTQEFIDRYQHALIKYYRGLLDYCQQRKEDMRLGKGMFADNEPLVIPGAKGGCLTNKLFIQDISLLNHTSRAHDLLHNGGTITNEVIYTKRLPVDAPSSTLYDGAWHTNVNKFLEGEMSFDDNFGYDATNMWGVNWEFHVFTARGNVTGIKVPTLFEGNTASHEFINLEYCYDASVSEDKTLIFLDGATHGYEALKEVEKFPGEFGDPVITFADYVATWLAEPGRFMD